MHDSADRDYHTSVIRPQSRLLLRWQPSIAFLLITAHQRLLYHKPRQTSQYTCYYQCKNKAEIDIQLLYAAEYQQLDDGEVIEIEPISHIIVFPKEVQRLAVVGNAYDDGRECQRFDSIAERRYIRHFNNINERFGNDRQRKNHIVVLTDIVEEQQLKHSREEID